MSAHAAWTPLRRGTAPVHLAPDAQLGTTAQVGRHQLVPAVPFVLAAPPWTNRPAPQEGAPRLLCVRAFLALLLGLGLGLGLGMMLAGPILLGWLQLRCD